MTDDKGIVTFLNLLVGTQNSSAAINMSVEKAARGLGKIPEGADGDLNLMEMAYRAYDPCMACATY
jgi:F420-non-reducing hydrogenase large subunit